MGKVIVYAPIFQEQRNGASLETLTFGHDILKLEQVDLLTGYNRFTDPVKPFVERVYRIEFAADNPYLFQNLDDLVARKAIYYYEFPWLATELVYSEEMKEDGYPEWQLMVQVKPEKIASRRLVGFQYSSVLGTDLCRIDHGEWVYYGEGSVDFTVPIKPNCTLEFSPFPPERFSLLVENIGWVERDCVDRSHMEELFRYYCGYVDDGEQVSLWSKLDNDPIMSFTKGVDDIAKF